MLVFFFFCPDHGLSSVIICQCCNFSQFPKISLYPCVSWFSVSATLYQSLFPVSLKSHYIPVNPGSVSATLYESLICVLLFRGGSGQRHGDGRLQLRWDPVHRPPLLQHRRPVRLSVRPQQQQRRGKSHTSLGEFIRVPLWGEESIPGTESGIE